MRYDALKGRRIREDLAAMYAYDDPRSKERAAELARASNREWIYMWITFVLFVILTILMR